MFRATTECTFSISTSNSGPSGVGKCFVHFDFDICFAPQQRAFFSLIWLDGSAPAALASLPSAATNHWKNAGFGDISTFSRTCILFLTLFFSGFLSSFLFSSFLFPSLIFSSCTCPSLHVVRNLTSKLLTRCAPVLVKNNKYNKTCQSKSF